MSAPTPTTARLTSSARHRLQVLLRVGHRRGHDRVVGRRQAQRRLVIQRLGRPDRRVCGRSRRRPSSPVRPVDRPPQRVDHHLPDQRRHRQDAGAVAGVGTSSRVEHHRHRPDVGVHRRLVLEAGRDPRRLLRRQQIVRRGRLDLDHAADRVLDLVHLVEVPAGDQPVALVEVAAAQRAPAAAQARSRPGWPVGPAIVGRSAKSLSESAETVTPLDGTTWV